jgi:hypothetical protein
MRSGTFNMILLISALWLCSCSHSKKFSNTYYQQNDSLFQSISRRYKNLYEQRPFSAGMSDKAFKSISFEILTDSIKYVYNFNIGEQRFNDTLSKYKFDVKGINALIADMQRVHCTWITNLDYYENLEKKYLVFVSIRHRKLKAFLRPEKYFTLAFFNQPQHFDNRGRLLDNQDRKTLHKINGGLFWKINDRVCYSLSGTFR